MWPVNGTLREHLEHPNDSQLHLFGDDTRLRRRFLDHREKYPWVWADVKMLAVQARREGRSRIGIAALFEVARWNTKREERDASGFKLDNSMRAYYARSLMQEIPELAGLFETRRLRSL